MSKLTLRPMTADDAAIVAQLHAASWRTAYREILSASYLDGEIDQDREIVWRERLAELSHSRFGVLAVLDDEPVGFVFVIGAADERWGTLIDNLHVATAARSSGIGPQLLAAAASGIETRGLERRVHLWVYDANARARVFYARMGGVEVETTVKPTADGGMAKEWRVAWDDVHALRRPSE